MKPELLNPSILVGKCNCLTKTPESKYHKQNCPVWMFGEINKLRTYLYESNEIQNKYTSGIGKIIKEVEVSKEFKHSKSWTINRLKMFVEQVNK